MQDEIPSGFSVAGHVGTSINNYWMKLLVDCRIPAHVNLRSQHLPFKNLIGSVILDKAQGVRTVVNKVDNVGEESEYRTFKYEILAGDPDLNVRVTEQQCVFHLGFGKVYWNSRLSTEHQRLVTLFKPGQAICDVMAGIGPFSIPAGKRDCFVWANDLNPECYDSLNANVRLNKVQPFIKTSCEDGRQFIKEATHSLLRTNYKVQKNLSKSSKRHTMKKPVAENIVKDTQPRIFSHYVMNLPASAVTFLSSFIGLYPKWTKDTIFSSDTEQLPMIHVYCFKAKNISEEDAAAEVCTDISNQLKTKVSPGDKDLSVYDVRDVAPNKKMLCASFRLPAEIAFSEA